MATARALIADALRDLGVLEASEEAEAADENQAFTRLNRWVTNLDTQRATIFTVKREVFPLVANTQSYTIGPGGTFVTIRPLWCEGHGFIPDRAAALPVEINAGRLMTLEEYRAISVKTVTSTVPHKAYYDHGFTGTGLGAITVFPKPTTSVCDLVLYLPRPMQQFEDLTTDYAFPPGYEEAVVANLAVRLAPLFRAPISDDLRQQARETMASLKRANVRSRELGMDPIFTHGGRLGGYNVRTDTYR